MEADEVILLVGGRGTRLAPVVSEVPKPLADVAGRPFLAWVLDHFDRVGLRRVILATGYMADQFEARIGRRWGALDVLYSCEDSPLGTGGAIRRAAQFVTGNGVHVVNGDTFLQYVPAQLERVTASAGASIGVALAQVPDVSRYGAVNVHDGRIASFREKGGGGPGLINAGSYFVTSEALRTLPTHTPLSFERDVLLPGAAAGRVAAFCETDKFIDIGVPEDYFQAQILFSAQS